jgi:lysine-N-methylase
MQDTIAPDYYDKFQCNGPQCPDTCCSGWSVHIDRETYRRYKSNRHKTLAPLMKLAVKKNQSPNADNENNFGVMQMRADGACHFLQSDQLCMIQSVMGETALSDTCRIYPRYLNRFGQQREKSLGISCPRPPRLPMQPTSFRCCRVLWPCWTILSSWSCNTRRCRAICRASSPWPRS